MKIIRDIFIIPTYFMINVSLWFLSSELDRTKHGTIITHQNRYFNGTTLIYLRKFTYRQIFWNFLWNFHPELRRLRTEKMHELTTCEVYTFRSIFGLETCYVRSKNRFWSTFDQEWSKSGPKLSIVRNSASLNTEMDQKVYIL